jgi:hypothetical protein
VTPSSGVAGAGKRDRLDVPSANVASAGTSAAPAANAVATPNVVTRTVPSAATAAAAAAHATASARRAPQRTTRFRFPLAASAPASGTSTHNIIANIANAPGSVASTARAPTACANAA